MDIQKDFRDLLELFNKNKVEYIILGNLPVHFFGKQEYIQNKRSTGRLKDLADLEALGES